MLELVIGRNWVDNRKRILASVAEDVRQKRGDRVLLVPELISHDMERRLSLRAGDTASRFAEVLSFTRLARRVADSVGHTVLPCLDEGGRVAAMAAAIAQVRSKLKFFAAVESRPDFISGLVETVDECKRCGVLPEHLMDASRETTGVLAQKLEELSLIFGAYDAICVRGKRDPRDQLTWLLEELEDGNYASEHVFYLDGFSDFTRQQMDILTHLICNSRGVTVSLTCDQPDSAALAFERPGETASELIRIAKRFGVPYRIVACDAPATPSIQAAQLLFEGPLPEKKLEQICAFHRESVFDECEVVAKRIIELVRSGSRYRQISVVCSDITQYEEPIRMIFGRCGIPVYMSGTQSLLERPVIATVLCAMEAALSGFEYKRMLAYLRTALSPLALDECDLVENYVLMWNISGKKWADSWQMHPRGLATAWTDEDRQLLAHLNMLRCKVIQPVLALRQGLMRAESVSAQIRCTYDFLEAVDLARKLTALADRLDADGDLQNAQVLDQLWEILINALEQMHDILGNGIWEPEGFVALFRILLSQYNVGTIPAVLDSVTVGSVSSMRCQETDHLFVLGVLEGALPAYGSAAGVLTDQDRSVLRDLGMPLNGGALETMQTSFSEIYGLFSGASVSVTLSHPDGQPSYLYQRLAKLAGMQIEDSDIPSAALVNEKHAASFLLRTNDRMTADALGIGDAYCQVENKKFYAHGAVSPEGVEALYGKELDLSASRIDTHANCAMSYFLKYGLRAKERKPAEVDPAQFGTFVHDVLEKTARRVVELGGFHKVSLDETLQIAAAYAKAYIGENFSDLDSERIVYLLNRNNAELDMIVEELWNELSQSGFSPAMFELYFGENGTCPAIEIQGENVRAKLRGFVDRVDIWEHEGKTYFRVVDYKTGKKTFDYCDIFNGIGLQMLLYLFALSQSNTPLLGRDPVLAGVQYFPARAPFVPVDDIEDASAVKKERAKNWKRSGILLDDEQALLAMDPEEPSLRMPFKRKKEGGFAGDLANENQFSMLRSYIFRYLRKMVDDISSGNVTANPYTRDNANGVCRFCPYGMVCHEGDVQNRRVFQNISADRFWEDVSREVKNRG